jgi:hypothetical protein
MTLTGRCACGAVRYAITAPPIRAFQCQCKDCQRDTGGGHSSVAVFNRSALTIEGVVAEISRDADTGNRKTKGFCGACGSPIYNKPDVQPDLIGIYVGTLDDASAFQPSIILYHARSYAWDKLDPDVPRLPHWHEKKS